VRRGLQQLNELEASAVIGAEPTSVARSGSATATAISPSAWPPEVGNIVLLIPKLRSGGSLPSILEPHRRVDQAHYGVVMESYVIPQECPGWIPGWEVG